MGDLGRRRRLSGGGMGLGRLHGATELRSLRCFLQPVRRRCRPVRRYRRLRDQGRPRGVTVGPADAAAPTDRVLSSVLLQYFRITNGSLGAARARRIQDFAEAYGGVVVNRTLTNRAAVIARLRPSVEEFADYYLQWHLYKSPDTQQPPSGAPPLNVLLNAALDDMVPRFVNWLATQMQP